MQGRPHYIHRILAGLNVECRCTRAIAVLAGLLILCSTAYGSVRDRPVSGKPFSVAHAAFGLMTTDGLEDVAFRESTHVPLRVGQGYGWFIRLDSPKDTIQWREEFTVPAAPDTWGVGKTERVKISEARRTSVTEREVQAQDGLIFHFWYVAPGDPKGHHVIRVYVEGFLVSIFMFDVQ